MQPNQAAIDDSSLIERMIYSRIPKYDVLHQIFPAGTFSVKGDSTVGVVVCVDLHTILNPLVSDQFFETAAVYSRYNRNKLAALIINFGGFLRNYISKYHGLPCDIYFYYSFDDYVQGTEYRKKYHEDLNGKGEDAKKYFLDSMDTIKKFLSYVPNTWLINTSTTMRHLAPYSIRKGYDVNKVKFLLITNEVGLQYCVLNDNFIGLRLADRASKMICGENILSQLFKSTKPFELDPIHYANIIAMIGNERDGIPGIEGFGGVKAARLIEKQMGVNKHHCRVERLIEDYPFILSDELKKQVLNNSAFHAANFRVQSDLSGLDEVINIECSVDHISDIIALKQVTDKVFKNDISLEMLLMGTEY